MFRQNGKWVTENRQLLESKDIYKTINYLTTSWLHLMLDENFINKFTKVQNVMLDHSGTELFISFDTNFLAKQHSIAQKLDIIESLLKSIRDNIPNINTARILVRHVPMQDTHLDFNRPWPVNGFLPNK